MDRRIMFAGVSGIGKTTLAKEVSKQHGIPFISGSYTDLVYQSKGLRHRQILGKDPEDQRREDFQLLNLRVLLTRDNPNFVSDRSFLDSAAYYTFKQSQYYPTCEIEDFISLCITQIVTRTTHLIYLPYTLPMYDQWEFEDNDKRIVNKWFQLQIGNIFESIVEKAIGSNNHLYYKEGGAIEVDLKIPNQPGSAKMLIVNSLDLNERMKQINNFLNRKDETNSNSIL